MSTSKSKNINKDAIHTHHMIEKFLDISAAIILILDMSGEIVLINKKGEELLGKTADELIGKNWFSNCLPSGIRKQAKSEFDAFLKTDPENNTRQEESEVLTKDKQEKIISWTHSLLTDENEEIIGTLSSGVDITAEREAQRKFEENEAKYQTLYEDPIVGIWRSRISDGKLLLSNVMQANLLGYDTPEEAISSGVKLSSLYPKERREQLLQMLKIHGSVSYFEAHLSFPDGKEQDISISAKMYPEKDYMEGVVIDITEKKKLEDLLREREIIFNALTEAAFGSILVTQDGKCVYVNDNSERLFGHTREESLGQSALLWVAPEYHEKVKNIIETDYEKPYEIMARRKDGTTFPAEVIAKTTFIKGRKTRVASLRDITIRVQAQEALRESEEKMRQLFESSQDVIFITDVDGAIKTINPAAERLFGYPLDEMHTMSTLDVYANPSQREAFLNQMMRYGFVKDFEMQIVTRDGALRDCQVNATAVRNGEGDIIGFQGSLRDITEKKLLEIQLIHSQRMEAVGQLAGGMAHNFNNILVGIMGYAEFLLSKKSKDDPDYKALSTIHDGTLRASELTRQLLDIARGGDFIRKPLSLNDVVDRVLPLVSGTFHKAINIDIHMEESIAFIEGDPGQLEQSLLNLCINARDAMPDGGTLTIETKGDYLDEEFCRRHLDAHEGDYVILTVSDTGVGMTRDVREHVFEPFFSTKEEKGGTGMGLATVYSTVRHHGGIITFYSEKDQGTTFRLYFPAIQGFREEEIERVEIPDQLGTETILLVDDEAMVLEVWSDYLLEKGYKVFIAEEGEAAVEIFKQKSEDIDLVILDYVLPGISAREVLRQIREIKPDTTVVITSGYSENGQAGAILSENVDGFIQKPTPLTIMHRKIREYLAVKKHARRSE